MAAAKSCELLGAVKGVHRFQQAWLLVPVGSLGVTCRIGSSWHVAALRSCVLLRCKAMPKPRSTLHRRKARPWRCSAVLVQFSLACAVGNPRHSSNHSNHSSSGGMVPGVCLCSRTPVNQHRSPCPNNPRCKRSQGARGPSTLSPPRGQRADTIRRRQRCPCSGMG